MTAERFTLDSNILVYAADADAGVKHDLALQVVERAARRLCTLTVQALAEFYYATTRKGLVPRADAALQVREWMDLFPVVGADQDSLSRALIEAERSRISVWDAMLLCTAVAAGCTAVLSEDMGDGTRFRGLVVRNPFVGPGLSEQIVQLLGD